MHGPGSHLTKYDIFGNIACITRTQPNKFININDFVMRNTAPVVALRWLMSVVLLLCALQSLAHTGPVPLTSDPRHDVGHHAQWLIDRSGQQTINDIAAKPDSDWQKMKTGLSLGFTNDVVWLKVPMARLQASDPTKWYLVLGQTILKDVRLYKQLENGGFSEHFGTQSTPQAQRDVVSRRPTFVIEQDDLKARNYWLRIQTPTAMNTSVAIVQPEVFASETTRENFLWGLMFGAYLITIIFYIAFWSWTRETIHKYYVGYITINFLAALFTGGWPTQFSQNTLSSNLIDLLGIWIACSIAAGTLFSTGFIELERKNPKFHRVLVVAGFVATFSGVVMVASGNYRWTVPMLQVYSMCLICTFLLVSTYYAWRGDRKSQFFLFAFSFFYLGVFYRYLRNGGHVEPNFWNENIYQIAAFVHMMVMSIGIFSNYNKLRKEKQKAELRADAEAHLRQEQREFLSLVSHEFRTPLTISGASADNLLQQPELNGEARLRVEKIVKANERMRSLMETYLSKERLLMDTQNLNIQTHDVHQLCRLAVADMSDATCVNPVIEAPTRCLVQCDAEMVRIALNNLLQNALRYSPQPKSVKIGAYTTPKYICITVADHGPGIPEGEIELIFTRYFRGKNSLNQPGAGLGLHLTQTIAKRHGGSIAVRNLRGGGCEFCLSLPR